jgi:magnesium-transporting ATPase (P-type)
MVFANVALSFVQNHRVKRVVEMLDRAAPTFTAVVRGGYRYIAHARKLMPEGILAVEDGDKVPAGGRLLAVAGLR